VVHPGPDHPQPPLTAAPPFRTVADGLRLAVKLAPGAARQRLEGCVPAPGGGSALKIAVAAPAVDGKANAALVKLLADALGVAKGTITVVAGATQRRKLLHIAGEPGSLARRLAALLEPGDAGR
jgi:uncharacterized protein (TIGR00251 family)